MLRRGSEHGKWADVAVCVLVRSAVHSHSHSAHSIELVLMGLSACRQTQSKSRGRLSIVIAAPAPIRSRRHLLRKRLHVGRPRCPPLQILAVPVALVTNTKCACGCAGHTHRRWHPETAGSQPAPSAAHRSNSTAEHVIHEPMQSRPQRSQTCAAHSRAHWVPHGTLALSCTCSAPSPGPHTQYPDDSGRNSFSVM
jgi:hypothetical protein